MKNRINLLSIFIFFLLFSVLSFGQDSTAQRTIPDKTIEKSLIQGVETDNLGLKVSSAYYLGERKTESAVIPLMNILNTDKSDEARIMAAVSLHKIGTKKALYAVERASEFNSSESVRRFCKIFHEMALREASEKK